MKTVNELRNSMFKLREEVIGLIKIKDAFELVLTDDGDYVHTIDVTQMGSVNTTCGLPKSRGKFIAFPLGLNMNDMLSNPSVWVEYMNNFN